MKIQKLSLKNFAKFVDFQCEFDGKITKLVGVNGSGKSTIGLTAIVACLKGIAEKSKDGQIIGERFRFIGQSKKSADIMLTLIDEKRGNAEIKVSNHITQQGNEIRFDAPPDYPISEQWLADLFNAAFVSAKNFTALSSKEQALLLGIDPSEYDGKIKALKDEYTFLNREYRALGDPAPVEEIQSVDIMELVKKKNEIDKFNQEQNFRRQQIEKTKDSILDIESHIKDIEKKIKELQEDLKSEYSDFKKTESQLNTLPEPRSLQDPAPIMNKIEQASETNNKALAYREYIKVKTQKEIKLAKLNSNKKQQEKVFEQRTDFIKKFNTDFDDLTIDDDGGLLLKGRPIKEPYFSKGELEIIVAKLYASTNPEWRIRFIDEFNVLDEANQTKLIDTLLTDGFQLIIAEVGDKAIGENVLLLRECKIVENYKQEKLL